MSFDEKEFTQKLPGVINCPKPPIMYSLGSFGQFLCKTCSIIWPYLTDRPPDFKTFRPASLAILCSTDYVRVVRKSPSLHSRKSNPNPKLIDMAEAYFVCHIGPKFQISLIYAFIGCPCLNVSTTPLRQWGFQQCLPFSWKTLRGKYCRYPIAGMGVVDMFRPYSVSVLHQKWCLLLSELPAVKKMPFFGGTQTKLGLSYSCN